MIATSLQIRRRRTNSAEFGGALYGLVLSVLGTDEAYVDFAVNVLPFSGSAESAYEFFEDIAVLGGVLKPGEEVERLTEVAAVVEAARDSREILKADIDVSGLFFEDAAAFVLRKIPPGWCFTDGDERGACGLRTVKALLLCEESIGF
jgi:hypothetical protein